MDDYNVFELRKILFKVCKEPEIVQRLDDYIYDRLKKTYKENLLEYNSDFKGRRDELTKITITFGKDDPKIATDIRWDYCTAMTDLYSDPYTHEIFKSYDEKNLIDNPIAFNKLLVSDLKNTITVLNTSNSDKIVYLITI